MSEFDTLINDIDIEVLAVMGDSVTYSRGADSVLLTAVVTDSNITTIDGDNVIRYRGEVAFLIRAADIVLAAVTKRPQRGDNIIWHGNNYEVTDPVYEPDDPAEIMLRVYAKFIGS